MISISLCMIVKNEEQILTRCLDSYRPICDEMIIVDTGSTDATKEIAARYTDKIYTYEWIDDFADARNFAFSKATCDYIFSADADEVLDEENLQRFLDLKQSLLSEIDIVQMKYVNQTTFNTVYNFEKEYRPKLFKRLRTFVWTSPIHETVRIHPVIFDSDIEILHLPENNHNKRDFSTFIKAFERGISLSDSVIIMLCKELFISGADEDFISFLPYFQALQNDYNRSKDCQENIACVLAKTYRITKNIHEFFKICLKNVAVEACAEICMELGTYYKSVQDYEEAILWFINAVSETSAIIDIHCNGNLPLLALADCYNILSVQMKEADDYELAYQYQTIAEDYAAQAESWCPPQENV